MPIKLPKAFPRRKSSGNALEENSTTEPSFRVLERPSDKPFEGPDNLRRRSQGRPLSTGLLNGHTYPESHIHLNASNRGSGATNNSASSGGQDNSSSSARFSSSSTLPSSTDIALDDKPQPKQSFTMPAPAVPESGSLASLKAAGRAFSFGRKKAGSQVPIPRPVVDHAQSDGRANYTRERAHTESSYTSESTATPPRLLETGLDFGSTDDFGLMFEGFGKRSSRIGSGPESIASKQTDPASPRQPPSSYAPDGLSKISSSPHNIDRLRDSESFSSSWRSCDSQDELLAGPMPPMERTFSYEGAEERISRPSPPTKSRSTPLTSLMTPPTHPRASRPPPDGLRRIGAYAKPREAERASGSFQDNDTSLVMNSISLKRRLERAGSGEYQDSDNDDNPATSLVQQPRQPPSPQVTAGGQQYPRGSDRSPGPALGSSHSNLPSDTSQPNSVYTTPRAKRAELVGQGERSMFDASPPFLDGVHQSRGPNVQSPPKPQTQNKIMTPAQFERYRKEQEMNQAFSAQTNDDASDEEGDDYDDDDEIERNKELAKQRRKQEAHLAVYRQQMMKVTGEQQSDSPNMQHRPSVDRSSMNTPNMQQRASTIEINFDSVSENGKTSDDEDEEIPLGVLAAHGFPSKNRPPMAMSGKEPRIQYKSESYPPPPASTSGASQAGRASGLPPFAKSLPPDPYFGASLVKPSNRESLAYRHQGTPSNSAGLVGVIAGEERARAARRGSPNAQGNFGSPMPQSVGQMPGMPLGMSPMMSPADMATMQMSEQMSQMMQMQMQWMQQMQHMMSSGMQPGQQMPMTPVQPGMMPGMMPPAPGQLPRPTSSGPHPGPGTPGMPPQAARAMSMISPSSTPPWPPQHMNNRQSRAPSAMDGGFGGPGRGYTPSIAPSERSNVGMPSRYRPVSIAPADENRSGSHSRSTTMNGNTLQPGGPGPDGRLSPSRGRKSNLSVRPVAHTNSQNAGSDEDDEEGWEEMKKQRDKKRGLWRLNRKKDEPAEFALEYYDYNER